MITSIKNWLDNKLERPAGKSDEDRNNDLVYIIVTVPTEIISFVHFSFFYIYGIITWDYCLFAIWFHIIGFITIFYKHKSDLPW
jgi:hypothetical protein